MADDVRSGASPETNRFDFDPVTNTWKQKMFVPYGEKEVSNSLLGLGTDQWGTLTNLGGLAMKAIALPGQMEYYGAQTDLAKQQLASNQQAMADRKTFNNNWATASNGLAGQSFTGAAGYGTGTVGSTDPRLNYGNK